MGLERNMLCGYEVNWMYSGLG